jgi:hypothetical protein
MKPTFGRFAFSPNIGMDHTILTRVLYTERLFLPVIEKMAQLAAPDKRANVLRLMAHVEQDIAKHRDALHEP